MDSASTPSADRLGKDLARVSGIVGRPFADFLTVKEIAKIDTSKSKSILPDTLRDHFGVLDRRIRFVEASVDGHPKGTIKLFGVAKALVAPAGGRLNSLLDGGVVAVAVSKRGAPMNWRAVGLYDFIPTDKELARHEADLDALLRLFPRKFTGGFFPATTIGVFQIRTGPSRYDVYLQAQAYFEKKRAY